jgi:hypothetical protein
MRDFHHETVFEGSETEGGSRRRSWRAQKGSCARSLRRFGADHKALPEIASRETGDVEPKPVPPGPPARKGAALQAVLPAQARANPDLSLALSTASCLKMSMDPWSQGIDSHDEPRLREVGATSLKRSPSSRPSATKKNGSAGANR